MRSLLGTNQKEGQTIKLLACPGLADVIEANYTLNNAQPIIDHLTKLFTNLNFTPDTIVLGCTHYSLIKDLIQPFFPSAQLIDGNTGVSHRVQELAQTVQK